MGFSVLMSVYKEEKPEYLAEAFDSLKNQTLQANEIILIQDGPLTKELNQQIREFSKKYTNLVTYRFPENVQLGRALARGLELCSHELVARMDTDDIAVNDRFMQQYAYMMEHPEVSVCGGWMEEFNDEGTYSKIKKMPEDNVEIRRYGKYRNPVNHMTVMFRKSSVLTAGGYRHMPLLEDYDLWSRMMVNGMEFHNLPAVLVKMRTNSNLYNRRGGWKYFCRYMGFRRVQKDMGWYNYREYIIAIILTFAITMQPAFLRKIVYQKLLRK